MSKCQFEKFDPTPWEFCVYLHFNVTISLNIFYKKHYTLYETYFCHYGSYNSMNVEWS